MTQKQTTYKGLAIGACILCVVLTIALVVSVLTSNLTPMSKSKEVTVSGTIQWDTIFRIEFVDARARDYTYYNLPNGTIQTSAPVLTDHSYSVVLVGGLSYEVKLYESASSTKYTFSLYVPEGVTYFTADF